MRRRLRILVGLMAWGGGLVGIGWLANNQADKALGQRVAPQLWQYASGSRSSVPLEISDQLDLRGGDPIFLFPKDGRLVQIGEIRGVAIGPMLQRFLGPIFETLKIEQEEAENEDDDEGYDEGDVDFGEDDEDYVEDDVEFDEDDEDFDDDYEEFDEDDAK